MVRVISLIVAGLFYMCVCVCVEFAMSKVAIDLQLCDFDLFDVLLALYTLYFRA